MLRFILISLTGFLALSGSFAQDASLPPGAMLLPESSLPEYESLIDHQRYILEDSAKIIKQGKEIYQQVCHNCHGDLSLSGSIPNSLRFGEGEFQHGNDPYTMYQTITRGWRQMVPQVQLVPREKYAVIQYIRSHFLEDHNPGQYFEVTESYLESLPKGSEMGPEPVKREPWRDMDYGDFLIGTFEIAPSSVSPYRFPEGEEMRGYVSPNANIAYKGIVVRLDEGPGGVSHGNTWLIFEHDTMRVAGVWRGEGAVDWQGINFDGLHWYWPRTSGEIVYETEDVPGWANPATGKFDDERFIGMDGRRFGPLPREWTHFKGIYRYGSRIVISYTVGETDILESYLLTESGAIARIMNIGKSSQDLTLRLANKGTDIQIQGSSQVTQREQGGFLVASIPAKATPLKLAFVTDGPSNVPSEALDLEPLTEGGPAQWAQTVAAPIIRGAQDGPFQWDSFTISRENPWKSWLRATGIDFSPDGKSAYLCTWEGDVWKVGGIADETTSVTSWKRIAAGLFQPLGIKLVKGEIFVTCRNQLVRLKDLNGDDEIDFYENFNSDHQVTEHFHEFAMGLQVDDDGNFYYAKSGCHGRTALVAQHGTLLKVSADGSTTEILAKGFRAANGVCLNPDGTFFVTDQEGYWNPMNRINWVVPGDNFYGNMWGYDPPEDSSDSAMEQPLCWVDKAFDRSPAELLWVESEKWGPLNGKLLNLSYGQGRLELISYEMINGQAQGGMIRLPMPDLPTGIMRGRFHSNGHLYVCGMSAWATDQIELPGGFYRVRATEKPSYMPIGLEAKEGGIEITFTDPLDPDSIALVDDAFAVRTWALLRSEKYGSDRYDEKTLDVSGASLSKDGKTLTLGLPDIEPVWQMSIQYKLKSADGAAVDGEIQNTIHQLGSSDRQIN